MKKEFKIERNINKRLYYLQHLKSEVKCIFRMARKHKSTFDAILNSVNERVRKNPYWFKIGNEGRANVQGHIEANFNNMYDELEWCCWYNGEFRGLTKNFEYWDGFDQNLMRTGHVYKGTQVEYNPKSK